MYRELPGKLKLADGSFMKIAAVLKTIAGPCHADTLDLATKWALVLQLDGQLQEAVILLQRTNDGIKAHL